MSNIPCQSIKLTFGLGVGIEGRWGGGSSVCRAWQVPNKYFFLNLIVHPINVAFHAAALRLKMAQHAQDFIEFFPTLQTGGSLYIPMGWSSDVL